MLIGDWTIREQLGLISVIVKNIEPTQREVSCWDKAAQFLTRVNQSFIVKGQKCGKPMLYADYIRSSGFFTAQSCKNMFEELLEKHCGSNATASKSPSRSSLAQDVMKIMEAVRELRIDELKRSVDDGQQKLKRLERDIEMIKSGRMDHQLENILEQAEREGITYCLSNSSGNIGSVLPDYEELLAEDHSNEVIIEVDNSSPVVFASADPSDSFDDDINITSQKSFEDTSIEHSEKMDETKSSLESLSPRRRSTRASNPSLELEEIEMSEDEGGTAQAVKEDITMVEPESLAELHEENLDLDNSVKATAKNQLLILHQKAAQHRHAYIFSKPVTERQAPGYNGCVYRPMDLSKMKKMIDNGTVSSVEEFHVCLAQIFANAVMYNPVDSEIYNFAQSMFGEIVREISEAESEFGLPGVNVRGVSGDISRSAHRSGRTTRRPTSRESSLTKDSSTSRSRQPSPDDNTDEEPLARTAKRLAG